MGRRKSVSDYVKDISNLHTQLCVVPGSTEVQKKLARRINRWMELIEIRVQVAQQEKHEWTSKMIGYPTERMSLKKETGLDQIGDYHGIVKTDDGDRYIDIVIERKSIEDLYGTLIPEDNRARFYREIDRYKADFRFNSMEVLVEGSMTDFLLFQPEFVGGEFDYKRRFDTKKNTTINEKKMTVLADLLVAGVNVVFCDNPTLAAQLCGRVFRESVKKEYYKILGLPT